MTTLVQSAPQLTVDEAVRLAADLYGLDATAEPLPSERDQNFRLRTASGDQFVLKIANAAETREVLDLQNKAMGSGTGLQTCVSATGATHFVRLLPWIDGICFAEVKPHRPELLRSLGQVLAEMDTALENFDHPAAHREFYWDLRHAGMARQHLPLLSDRQRAIIEPFFDSWEKLNWQSFRYSVIHNDANDYNILVDHTGSRVVSILDYGDMVYSATVCNLAVALAYVMLDEDDPLAAAAQVVSAYHEIRPLTQPELEALQTLACTRLAMSVCYSAAQAREAPHNGYLNITTAPAWKLLERLSNQAPGLLARRRKHLGPSLSLSYREPLHFVRGWMQHLYDPRGRAYLDCVNNVAHVGHCHPRVVRAATGQMARLNTNTRYLDEHLVDYIERLASTLPDPLSIVYLVCSGSEANELALRLARTHTGGEEVIVVDSAYHGNTNALVEISPYKFNGPGGRGKPPHVHVVPIPGSTGFSLPPCRKLAAFFCESALGCAGQVILPPGYLRQAYTAVHAAGGVCVADEVQTGFGRAGSHFWMFETQGVVPDIVTMGKPIGNGHPMGAVVTTPEIAASFANGMEYFNTFGGNPVSCAVGLAVLDVIRDEGLQENARETGDYLLRGLKDLAQRRQAIVDVRGLGLFLGFELPAAAQATELVNRMKERGVLLSTDGPLHNVIKIKPPLVFNRSDADLLLDRLDAVLR